MLRISIIDWLRFIDMKWPDLTMCGLLLNILPNRGFRPKIKMHSLNVEFVPWYHHSTPRNGTWTMTDTSNIMFRMHIWRKGKWTRLLNKLISYASHRCSDIASMFWTFAHTHWENIPWVLSIERIKCQKQHKKRLKFETCTCKRWEIDTDREFWL